ncbi:peptide-methionine (S)-S-oxide reductase [Alkalihalobacillus sp. MEB130]|uniref:peptide-methionine (S)-S-oxide reductase n=1 Tax=Alkalihalobacillus sp. MEB130 TaxID=2976704 RepID=UPI0028DD84FB|nr:peptide-methionine (S)-S-oxide reductase [Alkalihalobacillus sp. MEB130]MDT8861258.1 peptide-methionine (S)-S-oxide reductase [Alkalihalobacillus sp. MEB130]
MERAVFGASEFFSKKPFYTVIRGIENVHVGQLKGANIDIVEIWFDPWKVSYTEIVDLFFDLHDPTTRQDQSLKNQSCIFFTTVTQLTAAKQKKNEIKQIIKKDVVTEITPICEHLIDLKQMKEISY